MKPSCGIAFLLLLLYSCQNRELQVNVSSIEIESPVIKRLDRDLFLLNEANFDSLAPRIETQYGRAYQKYLMNPLRLMGSTDSLYRRALLSFVFDRDIRNANRELQQLYTESKIQDLEEGITDMLKHFRYHFPSRALPRQVIACQSGWNYAFAYVDSSFLLGLDMYMGAKSEFYTMLAYPQYQVRKMGPEYILPDMARGWLLTEFDKAEPENTLLHHSIFYGKLFYAIKALLPHLEDSLIIGYTSKQMDYCRSYEKNIWSYMAEKNRLFENDLKQVRELTTEGPFTGAISKDCPPRIAMWMGWQIVRAFMRENENYDLEKLMGEQDAAKILNKSHYRP